jgi:hypothetical protein
MSAGGLLMDIETPGGRNQGECVPSELSSELVNPNFDEFYEGIKSIIRGVLAFARRYGRMEVLNLTSETVAVEDACSTIRNGPNSAGKMSAHIYFSSIILPDMPYAGKHFVFYLWQFLMRYKDRFKIPEWMMTVGIGSDKGGAAHAQLVASQGIILSISLAVSKPDWLRSCIDTCVYSSYHTIRIAGSKKVKAGVHDGVFVEERRLRPLDLYDADGSGIATFWKGKSPDHQSLFRTLKDMSYTARKWWYFLKAYPASMFWSLHAPVLDHPYFVVPWPDTRPRLLHYGNDGSPSDIDDLITGLNTESAALHKLESLENCYQFSKDKLAQNALARKDRRTLTIIPASTLEYVQILEETGMKYYSRKRGAILWNVKAGDRLAPVELNATDSLRIDEEQERINRQISFMPWAAQMDLVVLKLRSKMMEIPLMMGDIISSELVDQNILERQGVDKVISNVIRDAKKRMPVCSLLSNYV